MRREAICLDITIPFDCSPGGEGSRHYADLLHDLSSIARVRAIPHDLNNFCPFLHIR